MTTNQDIPAATNEAITAGDTIRITDTVTVDDGSAKNLTGADVVFAITEYRGHETILEKTTTGGGVTIADASNGILVVDIPGSDTEGLGKYGGGIKEYEYEIEVTDSSGDIGTVTEGKIKFTQDIA